MNPATPKQAGYRTELIVVGSNSNEKVEASGGRQLESRPGCGVGSVPAGALPKCLLLQFLLRLPRARVSEKMSDAAGEKHGAWSDASRAACCWYQAR